MSSVTMIAVQIKNPYQPDYLFTIDVDASSSTGALKKLLSVSYCPSSPPSIETQRLIYAGRLLRDQEILRNVVGVSEIPAQQKEKHSVIIHLYVAKKQQQQQQDTQQQQTQTQGENAKADTSATPVSAAGSASAHLSFLPSSSPSTAAASISSLYSPYPYHHLLQQQLPLSRNPSATYTTHAAIPAVFTQHAQLAGLSPAQLLSAYNAHMYQTINNIHERPHTQTSTQSTTPLIQVTNNPQSSTPPAAAVAAAAPQQPGPLTGMLATPLSRLSRYYSYVRRFVDVRLFLKLLVLLLVFSRQGDAIRFTLLIVAAVVAYLWQVGAFRRRAPEPPQDNHEQANAGPAAADQPAAPAGAGGAANNNNNEDAAAVRRHARAERRLAGWLNGGGMGGGDQDDEDEDIQLQREQLLILQQQHQAEMIRRGANPANAGNNNSNHAIAGDAAAALVNVGWIAYWERFIVGFFASLLPSWRPTVS